MMKSFSIVQLRRPSEPSRRIHCFLKWAAAFCLPIVIFLSAMFLARVYPFGSESFLTEDLKYQYIDFFTWLKRVVDGEASLFYSFSQGLGSNTWGLFSYYLSSPFNILILFFDTNHLTDFVILVTALKLGFIQLSIMYYLKKRFQLPYHICLLIGLGYSWSSWVATQLRNPMWLDALILLPIMLYGGFAFLKTGKWKSLVVSTALSIITCWYMGYMVILFLCLYMFVELANCIHDETLTGIKPILIKVLTFSLCMALSLGLSAWTFLPTIAAMVGGSSTPFYDYIRFDFGTLLSSLLPGTWRVNETPQIYFGLFTLLSVFAFSFNRDVDNSTKAICLSLSLIMLLSVWLVPLDFVWCGFRMPNGFYSRPAFLLCFSGVYCAGFLFSKSGEHELTRSMIIAAFAIFVLVLFTALSGSFLRIRYLIIAVGILVIYCGLLRMRSRYFLYAMALVACVEVTYYSQAMWEQLYVGYSQEQHNEYVSESETLINQLKTADDSSYRFTKTYTRASIAALNEGMANGYMEISSYSSAHNQSAIDFLNQMGYSNPGEFSTRYAEPNPVMDSLLGVKYVSTTEKPILYRETIYSQQGENALVYQNPNALSLGYVVSDKVFEQHSINESNPFEAQNDLFCQLTGIEDPLYTPIGSTVVEDTFGSRTWKVDIPDGAIGFVYVDSSSNSGSWLSFGDRLIQENERFTHSIYALQNEGVPFSSVEVSLSTFNPSVMKDYSAISRLNDGANCIFYALNLETYDRGIDFLSKNQLDVSSVVGNSLHASIESKSESKQLVMLTIPYDSGWSLYINGESAELHSLFNGACSGFFIDSGSNEIELVFCPPLLLNGILVTAISSIVFIGVSFFQRYKTNVCTARN